jgi:hypothetical protein
MTVEANRSRGQSDSRPRTIAIPLYRKTNVFWLSLGHTRPSARRWKWERAHRIYPAPLLANWHGSARHGHPTLLGTTARGNRVGRSELRPVDSSMVEHAISADQTRVRRPQKTRSRQPGTLVKGNALNRPRRGRFVCCISTTRHTWSSRRQSPKGLIFASAVLSLKRSSVFSLPSARAEQTDQLRRRR